MLRYVISGTIDGEYDFPNELFSGYCYEGWGNAWCMIEGIQARYVPAQEFISNPQRLDDVDILMAEFGHVELHQLAYEQGVFNIATESGAGFDIDRAGGGEKKQDFIDRLDKCSLILSTTHGGMEYLRMFTNTPVLDIPLPMDLEQFHPRHVDKFEDFTVCLGEIIESCYDDRPLQLAAAGIIRSLGIKIAASIGPQARDFHEADLQQLGFDNINWHPHLGLYEMSNDYLAKSHVSMMLGQRSTYGRFIYVSWAIGVPCIATRYQCQEMMCRELTVGYEQVDAIRELLRRLRDDAEFYQHCQQMGLQNVRKHLDKENIAFRIINEILPVYFNAEFPGVRQL